MISSPFKLPRTGLPESIATQPNARGHPDFAAALCNAYHILRGRVRGTEVQFVDYSGTERVTLAKINVSRLKTVVVGAGALGNEVVKALGLLGCGEVLIVDPDVVEPHNLTRSVLFRTEEAVGQSKAMLLTAACRHYFPETSWTAAPTEVADTGSEWVAESDLIFGCVDNELARLEIAYLGTKYDVPVCDAGLGIEDYATARVSFFPGRRSASFCCVLPPARRRELLTLWDCRSFPCWTPREPERAWPGTPTAAAIAGAMQVETGLRLLRDLRSGVPVAAQTLELELGGTPHLTSFRVPLNPACPFHEDMPSNCVLQAANSDMPARQLLSLTADLRLGTPVLLLDWPLCVSARCRACGYRWPAMKRLAALRRDGACPQCLSDQLISERAVHRIGYDSDLLDHKLSDLGMPDRHLYMVEFL